MAINFTFSDLYRPPQVNPINGKARSIPALNPVDMYGRVFFFSWFGFMIAFWAWYTFPPLLTVTIKSDLNLSPAEVANSNIVSLAATLLVRAAAGPLCDLWGSRIVFGGVLLLGAVPLGLAPLVQNAAGLYASRFFIGILGGAFVPCQVWSTGFFDKNVVGTANALTGGFGNAGGGITYFIMPAVFDSLVHKMGYVPSVAWRLTFLVPLAMVVVTGVGLLVLCPDTPTGKWSERRLHVERNLESHGMDTSASMVVDVPGAITDRLPPTTSSSSTEEKKHRPTTPPSPLDHSTTPGAISRAEFLAETVSRPSRRDTLAVLLCPQTAVHFLTYFCSFGGELAINSILGAYYLKNFPSLGQTGASNWAAMFGFLNFVTRPLGGVVGDLLYTHGGGERGLWLKKAWMHACGVLTGALLLVIGRLDPHDRATMFGLVALMAVFHEAGNGANFALVPHVHPRSNGLVSGVTGAGGNLGGVVFAVVFRFMGGGSRYADALWLIGILHVVLNVATCWVAPLPRGQVGGR